MDNWYETYFDDDYLRFDAAGLTPERDAIEVEGIVRALGLGPGAEILDLACGQGRHSVPLAQRGYTVTGLDLSGTLLGHARQRAEEAGVEIAFHHGDMREIPWAGRFDAAINLFSAFGYFTDEAENQKVLHAVYRALKPGGKFLIEVMPRDRLAKIFLARDWHETADGTLVWNEREFDPIKGVNTQRSWFLTPDGKRGQRGHSLRVYTATELDRMLCAAGLQTVSAWGGFDLSPYAINSRLIMLAQKPMAKG